MPGDARNRRSALLVSTMASFVVPFMGGAVNVAVPAIGAEFHADAVTLNWVVTAFVVTSAMLLLPFGRLADLVGRRRVFATGMALFTVATLACGLAPTLELLIAARVAQGVSSALMFGTAAAILVSVFPGAERGRVLGITVAAVYAGLATGPLLGGLLTQHFGWRSIFVVTAALGVPTYAVARWSLEGDWAEARGERYDLAGAVLCACAIGPLMVGVSIFETSALGPLVAAVGAVAVVAFIVHESRTAQPVLDVGLFRRNRLFAMSVVAALIGYAATFTSGYLMSIYLQTVRGLDPRDAGLVLVAAPLVQAVLSPFAGRLSDRVAPRYVASAGMAVCALGLGALALVDASTSLPVVVAMVGVLGIGFAFFSSPNTNAVMGSVERKVYGVASAALGTSRLVGMTLSMSVVSLLFGIYLGSAPIAPESAAAIVSASRVSFAIFAVLCLLGVPASLARGRASEGGTPERG